MQFETYGPFEFELDNNKRDFWKRVREQGERYWGDGLDCSIGCYLFSVKNGERYRPCYVGKAIGKDGFKQEIFTPHKKKIYQDCLIHGDGAPMIFLFPLVTSTSRQLSKPSESSKKIIDWVEKMLIGFSLRKNEGLSNLRDTKFLRECWIEGVFGKQDRGRPTGPAMAARKALF